MTAHKMFDEKFYSKTLGEDLDLIICLPPDFSPLYKYPLFIVQDGKDYFQFGKLARQSEELALTEQIQKAIFIGIPYKNVMDRREKYHPDGKQNDAYIRFLAFELVPYLEKRFPSFQMPTSRFLMGDSLGASVSLKAALLFPFTFGNVILHSPYVDEGMLTLAEKVDPSKVKIYHIIGDQETAVETTGNEVLDFLSPNKSLEQILTSRGFDYYFQVFNGDHRWKYWQPFIKESLQFMLPVNTFDLESMRA